MDPASYKIVQAAEFKSKSSFSSLTDTRSDTIDLLAATEGILTSTYSLVGREFYDGIVHEIGRWMQVETVILEQLVPMAQAGHLKRYSADISLSSISPISDHESCKQSGPCNCDPTSNGEAASPAGSSDSGSSSSSSSSRRSCCSSCPSSLCQDTSSYHGSHDSDGNNGVVAEDAFVIQAVYAAPSTDCRIKRNNIVPISFLRGTPHQKTLSEGVHVTTQLHPSHTIYPSHHTFVAIRLDTTTSLEHLGVLCILDSRPLTKDRIAVLTSILTSVRPRLEHEMMRLREQERLVQAKNAATADAENKLRFLADMSHEIRTPMNAVIALTDLLLQERPLLNDEQTEHLQVIQTSGHHLLTIINDILDLSKLNHDPKFKLENRRFSMRKSVRDTLNIARHQSTIGQHNKVIHVLECPSNVDMTQSLDRILAQLNYKEHIPNLEDESRTLIPLLWKVEDSVPDHLMGDTMRLMQIMLNLCSNAIKFTKHGGVQIHVKRYTPSIDPSASSQQQPRKGANSHRFSSYAESLVKRDESDENNTVILEVSVTDTGIGIPADRLPKLFNSFSQIDISTARRYGGTGLGLAISSTLANYMGGRLWVESELGVGSCFALILPMTVSAVGKHAESVEEQESSTAMSSCSPQSTSSDSDDSAFEPVLLPFTHSPSPTSSMILDARHDEPEDLPDPSEENDSTSNTTPSSDTISLESPEASVLTHASVAKSGDHDLNGHQPSDSDESHWKSRHNWSRPSANPTPRLKKASNRRVDTNMANIYPLRIILAEDNEVNQKIAVSLLKRLGYTNVAVANNGLEVLELMQRDEYDVIFMDLHMPDMDGLEATRAIVDARMNTHTNSHGRPLKNASSIYIIALTASAYRQDRQVCIDAGMNDFIGKPFTLEEMKVALMNCYGEHKKRKRTQVYSNTGHAVTSVDV